MSTTVADISWVKRSFLLPADARINADDRIRRIYSMSMQKATDTTLGGNFILNPQAQFTRYCDLKHNIRGKGNRGDNDRLSNLNIRRGDTTPEDCAGMGRWYSDKIDDNNQVVHFRCGVAAYNSLQSFYSNYYSVPAATLARTGRMADAFYTVGRVFGTILSIPLMPFVFASKVARFVFNKPASQYYYFKPAMLPYWEAVSSMVNGIAVNMGLMPRPISASAQHLADKEDRLTEAEVDAFHHIDPTIYRKGGGIDVFRISQKGQNKIRYRRQKLIDELANVNDYSDLRNVTRKRLYGSDISEVITSIPSGKVHLDQYAKLWRESAALGAYSETDSVADVPEYERRGSGWFSQLGTAWKDEAEMASEFVSFRVDYTGTQSESFSNSAGESSIQSQINGISASARESRFTMADGNIDTAGFSQFAVGAVKSFISGVSEGIGLSGLAQLAGSANVNIPQVYQSSSCDFNKISLTIPLRSPYAHPIARLQNLILPLCSLFAMSVPLATGKQSQTAPFLVQVFSQGRAHIRLGLVDSFSITRGVGDIGWNNNGDWLGCDINMSVIDLGAAMNMPLQTGFAVTEVMAQGLGYAIGGQTGAQFASAAFGSTYDDDNSYTDFCALLAGLPLEAEINPARKWALRMARQATKFDDATSPARLAMWAQSGVIGDVVKAFSYATDRQ